MRVVLTVPSLAREFGGPVDVAAGLADALGRLGTSVRVIGAGEADGRGEGLPLATTVRGTPLPRSFRSLRSAIRHADMVHVLGYRDPVGTVAARSAASARVPYLLETCGMHRPRLRSVRAKRAFDAAIGRRVVEGAAFVIATSELERRELVQDGVDDTRIRTRLNGLTLPTGDLPERGRIRSRFHVPPDAPLVLSLGRIARKKGLVDLVRAVVNLPSVYALIVGPDDADGTFDDVSHAARAGDGRVLVDRGGIWGPEKLAALVDADCFALPSMTENFGNAAAEAAAVGVPVVVTEECGIAEVLDLTAHRVVRVGRPDELGRAIGELVRPEARSRAAAAAGELRSLLDWTDLAEQQLALYRRALAR
jgi:glycosyltransferase involved in cell wall biosynthesis